ncbi:immunoglobulin lambda-1 light chain-like [Cetorhinus maximus]
MDFLPDVNGSITGFNGQLLPRIHSVKGSRKLTGRNDADFVFCLVFGADGQSQTLTQSPDLTVKPGNTATLDCNFGTDDGNMSWYKQTSGTAPQTSLSLYHSWITPYYAPGFTQQLPSVKLLGPSADEMSTKGAGMLVCLVSKLSMGFAAVSWTVDGSSTSSEVQTSMVSRNPDNTFSLSSYLTVPDRDWSSGKVFSYTVQQGTASKQP